MAFCEELKMVVNGRMRKGRSSSSTDAISFLKETLMIVPRENIGLIRGDVGFYSSKIMNFLENDDVPVSYLLKVRMTTGIQKLIIAQKNWHQSNDVDDNAIYAETEYKSGKWTKCRRVVLVGILKKEVKAKIKTGYLFKEYERLDNYEFHAFITNAPFSMIDVHRKYNQRGDAENRIKELKYDYSIDTFAMKSFTATDAAFRFVLIAYNMMTLFKKAIMQPRVNHRLSTIKFQCIAIGSYLVSSGRKKILKLAAEGKRRHFLEHIFENVESLKPPYSFSNA
jgi:hypothetical protein